MFVLCGCVLHLYQGGYTHIFRPPTNLRKLFNLFFITGLGVPCSLITKLAQSVISFLGYKLFINDTISVDKDLFIELPGVFDCGL